jgi:hypothetical protein
MSDECFVADACECLTRSSKFRVVRAAVIAAVRAYYAEHVAGTVIFGRLALAALFSGLVHD